jgi:hypothetical protein
LADSQCNHYNSFCIGRQELLQKETMNHAKLRERNTRDAGGLHSTELRPEALAPPVGGTNALASISRRGKIVPP